MQNQLACRNHVCFQNYTLFLSKLEIGRHPLALTECIQKVLRMIHEVFLLTVCSAHNWRLIGPERADGQSNRGQEGAAREVGRHSELDRGHCLPGSE